MCRRGANGFGYDPILQPEGDTANLRGARGGGEERDLSSGRAVSGLVPVVRELLG
ncbi:hypothetical protein ACRAWF_10145 [Streptomyces sp. L7]